jgi:hypothetical protein
MNHVETTWFYQTIYYEEHLRPQCMQNKTFLGLHELLVYNNFISKVIQEYKSF